MGRKYPYAPKPTGHPKAVAPAKPHKKAPSPETLHTELAFVIRKGLGGRGSVRGKKGFFSKPLSAPGIACLGRLRQSRGVSG